MPWPEFETILQSCPFIVWNTIYCNGIHPAFYLSVNMWYSICIGLVCVFCQCGVPVRAGGGVLVSTGALCSSSPSHHSTTGLLSAGKVGAHTPTHTISLQGCWLGIKTHILYSPLWICSCQRPHQYVPSLMCVFRLPLCFILLSNRGAEDSETSHNNSSILKFYLQESTV